MTESSSTGAATFVACGAGVEDDAAEKLFARLQRMISGAQMSQAIALAAELGLADLLADGSLPVDELAAATSTDADALRRLLRSLASAGLFAVSTMDSVTLLPAGLPLRRDSRSPIRDYLRWWSVHRWAAWGALGHCVATGQRAAGTPSGRAGMKDLATDPAAASVFHGAMTALTQVVARGVLRAYDFAPARHVCDIGGGAGELLCAVLQTHPHLSGTLFDLPHAIDGARHRLREAGLATRCATVAGSFFESVPAGADVYMLKTILHDWTDDEAVAILDRVRAAAKDDATLLLVERVLPERIEANPAHRDATLADLNMLVMLGGRERTADEFAALLARAGFAMMSMREATIGYSVIVANVR